MSPSFVFKQFELEQEKSAFKLGTDSVVLGSWVPVQSSIKILDMGAGTGILSLMMAQRLPDANILAVEIDESSALDCANNFSQSIWSNRLTVIHTDILVWSKKHVQEKFDLIITNPPYFINSLQNPDARKSAARHSDKLSIDVLTDLAALHLLPAGFFAVILPILEFNELKTQLEKKNIYANHICAISSFEHSEFIRKMGLFSFEKKTLIEETQYLYGVDKSRSNWYQQISKDFYIKE